MKPRTRRCDSNSPESGLIQLLSLHLRHGHLISVMLFRIMSAVADFKYLATMPSLIVRTMVACAVQRAGELEPPQYAWSPENLGMTFTKNRTSAESMVAEMEMNQHFGKTLATHFHVIKFG